MPRGRRESIRVWTNKLRCWSDDAETKDINARSRRSRTPTTASNQSSSNSQRHYAGNSEASWSRKNILNFEGDGIDVIAEILILEQLMLKIEEIETRNGILNSASYPYQAEDKELFRDMPQVYGMLEGRHFIPCHYFDYIGGAGAGGIAAILLGRLRYDVNTAIYHFQDIWRDALGVSSRLHLKKDRRPSPKRISTSVRRLIAYNQRQQHSLDGAVLFSSGDPYLSRTMVIANDTSKHGHRRRFRDPEYRLYSSWPDDQDQTGQNLGYHDHLHIWDVARITSVASLKRFDSFPSTTISHKAGISPPAVALYEKVRKEHADVGNPVRMLVSLSLRQDIQAGIDRIDHHDANRYCLTGTDFDEPQHDFDMSCYRALKDEEALLQLRNSVKEHFLQPSNDEILSLCANELVSARAERSRTPEWERRTLGVYFDCILCRLNVPPSRGLMAPSDALSAYGVLAESFHQDEDGDIAEITRKFLNSVKETRSTGASLDVSQFVGRDKPDVQFFVSPSLSYTSDYQTVKTASPVSTATFEKHEWPPVSRMPTQMPKARPVSQASPGETRTKDQDDSVSVFHSRKAFMHHLFDYHERPLPDAEHKAEIDRIVQESVRTKLS